jgi:hypothetical protein
MLNSIPSGRSGGLPNRSCLVWILSGLLLGGLAFWIMKKVSEDPYFLIRDSKQEETKK